MSIHTLRETFPDYAKDIKLNLSTVLSESGSEGLSTKQIWGIALACAYATRNSTLVHALETDAKSHLSETEIQAAKAAATIMAMNNLYYRATHLLSDKSFLNRPARLRMNILGSHGVSKIDFEFYSLAVSVINGCGMCIDSHTESLKKEGATLEGIQSCLRIAAVIYSAGQVLAIENRHS